MKGLERIGLLKMDFLGLTTLTVLDDTVQHDRAESRRRTSICNTLPLDDAPTYKLFARGDTTGHLPV